MSDSDRMLMEDRPPSQGRLGLRELTQVSLVRTELKKRRQKKMHRRRLSGFERRYSQLALENNLKVEKKRIDYVLVSLFFSLFIS